MKSYFCTKSINSILKYYSNSLKIIHSRLNSLVIALFIKSLIVIPELAANTATRACKSELIRKLSLPLNGLQAQSHCNLYIPNNP